MINGVVNYLDSLKIVTILKTYKRRSRDSVTLRVERGPERVIVDFTRRIAMLKNGMWTKEKEVEGVTEILMGCNSTTV